MRPIFIDTNAYAAFKNGHKTVNEIIQHAEVLGMSPIVIAELLAGFNEGNKGKQNRLQLQHFLESSRIKTFPITSDTAHLYSLIYSSLKRKGKPIPTNDMWIGAQALEHGCIMCTFDKHFLEIEGLIIANSVADLPL